MKHQKKIIILILLLFTISALSSANAQIQGWGVGPNIIQLPDGLKNATYQQTILIYNENDFDSNVTINSTGEVKDWLSFYEPSNLTIPITSTYVNNNTQKAITLHISIPHDTANGEYGGVIYITPKFKS